jgi:hypothetical protein
MTGTLPPNSGNHANFSMHNPNASAYHRPASGNTWSSLTARIQAAVKDGQLSQAQANQILAHLAQKHHVNG